MDKQFGEKALICSFELNKWESIFKNIKIIYIRFKNIKNICNIILHIKNISSIFAVRKKDKQGLL
jgi:hypothetical protein